MSPKEAKGGELANRVGGWVQDAELGAVGGLQRPWADGARQRQGSPRWGGRVWGIPEVGALFPRWPEVGARWDTQGVVSGIPVVERAGPVGPAVSVSRPSSPRAEVLRLRSQELMVGWLRAFCRSPTFWPSRVVTLPTLRLCRGRGGCGGRAGGSLGSRLGGRTRQGTT